jgi:hypothetical protein
LSESGEKSLPYRNDTPFTGSELRRLVARNASLGVEMSRHSPSSDYDGDVISPRADGSSSRSPWAPAARGVVFTRTAARRVPQRGRRARQAPPESPVAGGAVAGAGAAGSAGSAGAAGGVQPMGGAGAGGTGGANDGGAVAAGTGAAGASGTGGGTDGGAGRFFEMGNYFQVNPSFSWRVAIPQKPGKLEYTKVVIHEQFLAESCSIGDYNNDLVPDVSSGRIWYQGPYFKTQHPFRDGHDALPRTGDGPEINTGRSRCRAPSRPRRCRCSRPCPCRRCRRPCRDRGSGGALRGYSETGWIPLELMTPSRRRSLFAARGQRLESGFD